MPNLPFFDCNCLIGTRGVRHRTSPETLDDYLRDFAYYDITAALVHHAYAVEYSQDYGNRKLLDEIADYPQLLPEWVVIPHWAGEMAPPDELVAEMLSLNVRAARIMPVNVNTAGRDVLMAMLGPQNRSAANTLCALRDAAPLTSLAPLKRLLKAGKDSPWDPYFAVKSSFFSVIARAAKDGGAEEVYALAFRDPMGNVEILRWVCR